MVTVLAGQARVSVKKKKKGVFVTRSGTRSKHVAEQDSLNRQMVFDVLVQSAVFILLF